MRKVFGGEGSRTPVRKTFNMSRYMFSPSIASYPSTRRRTGLQRASNEVLITLSVTLQSDQHLALLTAEEVRSGNE